MNMSTAERKNRDKACERLSPEGRKYFDFIEFDENEKLVTEIRKHPFGLFVIYLIGGFVSVILLGLIVFVSAVDLSTITDGTGANTGTMRSAMVLMGLILLAGSVVMTFIASFLYKNNVIYVTSEKLAQVLYVSLFNRKISQLSIGDVQDITVKQNGIFAHAFNFGVLVVETAGEQQNYTFTYIPEPYQASKYIVDAHEKDLKLHGN